MDWIEALANPERGQITATPQSYCTAPTLDPSAQGGDKLFDEVIW